MAQIADITVKNAAGTDVVYNADVPSAGDKSPARYSQHAAGGIPGFRPSLELATLSNGSKDTRRMEVTYLYPVTYTDPATSLTKLHATLKFTGAFFMPEGLTVTQRNEAFVQLGNLLVSTAVRDAAQNGYAPT